MGTRPRQVVWVQYRVDGGRVAGRALIGFLRTPSATRVRMLESTLSGTTVGTELRLEFPGSFGGASSASGSLVGDGLRLRFAGSVAELRLRPARPAAWTAAVSRLARTAAANERAAERSAGATQLVAAGPARPAPA